LEHQDSLGNGSVIRPGDIQRMSAGKGITHSEKNASVSESVHLLQIWILPAAKGTVPGYEQKHLPVAETPGQWRRLADAQGREGAISLGQDASLFGILLPAGGKVTVPTRPGRFGWVQVARGQVSLGGTALQAGDGASFAHADLEVQAATEAEVLCFDLP